MIPRVGSRWVWGRIALGSVARRGRSVAAHANYSATTNTSTNLNKATAAPCIAGWVRGGVVRFMCLYSQDRRHHSSFSSSTSSKHPPTPASSPLPVPSAAAAWTEARRALVQEQAGSKHISPRVLVAAFRSLKHYSSSYGSDGSRGGEGDEVGSAEVYALVRELCNALRLPLQQPLTYGEACQCLEAFRGLDLQVFAVQRLALGLADHMRSAVAKRGGSQSNVVTSDSMRSVRMSGKTAARMISLLRPLSAALGPIDSKGAGDQSGVDDAATVALAYDALVQAVGDLVICRVGSPSRLSLGDITVAMSGLDGMSNQHPGVCSCLGVLRRSLALHAALRINMIDNRNSSTYNAGNASKSKDICNAGSHMSDRNTSNNTSTNTSTNTITFTSASAVVAAWLAPLKAMGFVGEAEGHRVPINVHTHLHGNSNSSSNRNGSSNSSSNSGRGARSSIHCSSSGAGAVTRDLIALPRSSALADFPSTVTTAEAFVLTAMHHLQMTCSSTSDATRLSSGGSSIGGYFDPVDVEGVMTGLQGMLGNATLMRVVVEVLTECLRSIDSSGVCIKSGDDATVPIRFPFSAFASALYCMQEMSNEQAAVEAFLCELSRVYYMCNEEDLLLLPYVSSTTTSTTTSPSFSTDDITYDAAVHEACLALFGLGRMADPSRGLESCLECVRKHILLVAKRSRAISKSSEDYSNLGGSDMNIQAPAAITVTSEQLAAALWGLRRVSSGCEEAMAVIRDLTDLAIRHKPNSRDHIITGQELALCLGGLANKRHDAESPSPTMRAVLDLLARLCHDATQEIGPHALYMDDDAIAVAAPGLAAVHSGDVSVRALLRVLAGNIGHNGTGSTGIAPRHLLAWMSCIATMSSDHTEVLDYISSVTRRLRHVSTSTTAAVRLDVGDSASLLLSIQGLDNAHPEVKALIRALTPCLFTTSEDISCVDVANAVRGFRSMTDGHCTVTAQLLLRIRDKISGTIGGPSPASSADSAATTIFTTSSSHQLLLSSAQFAMCAEGLRSLSGAGSNASCSSTGSYGADPNSSSSSSSSSSKSKDAGDSNSADTPQACDVARGLMRFISHRLVGS